MRDRPSCGFVLRSPDSYHTLSIAIVSYSQGLFSSQRKTQKPGIRKQGYLEDLGEDDFVRGYQAPASGNGEIVVPWQPTVVIHVALESLQSVDFPNGMFQENSTGTHRCSTGSALTQSVMGRREKAFRP
jgi:hypothetical protein